MRRWIQKIAWIVILALSAGLMLAAAASAGAPQAKTKAKQKQQKQQPDQTDQQQQTDQAQPSGQPATPPAPPKPVLTEKVTLRSSRHTKDTATAGFNGVGPDGKIKEALLNASPSADAKAKAAQLSLLEADAADLQAFAKEGKLTLPAKSAEKKGK